MDYLFCLFDVSLQGFLALGQSVQHLAGTVILVTEERSFIWAFPHESIFADERIIMHERPSGSCKIIAANHAEAFEAELKERSWAGFVGSDALQTPDAYLQSPSFEAVYEHETKTLQMAIYPRLVQNPLVRSLLETFNEVRVHEILFNTPLTRKPYENIVVTSPFIALEEYAEEFTSAKSAQQNVTLWHECLLKGHLPPFQLFLDLFQKKRGTNLAFVRLNDISLVACLDAAQSFSEFQFGYLNEKAERHLQSAYQVAFLKKSRQIFSVASVIQPDTNVTEEYFDAKSRVDSFIEILNSSEKTL